MFSRFSAKSSTATSAPFVCARPCCDTRFNAAQLVVERNKFEQTCVFHFRTSPTDAVSEFERSKFCVLHGVVFAAFAAEVTVDDKTA